MKIFITVLLVMSCIRFGVNYSKEYETLSQPKKMISAISTLLLIGCEIVGIVFVWKI